MSDMCDHESRGSMLLASVMTVSFGVLVFLGMVTSTLSERVRTEQVVQQAKALQLAHSGVEYALWEINYQNPPYTGTAWTPSDGSGTVHTYTKDTDDPPDGAPNITVTVTDANDGTTNIDITSLGQEAGSGVRRRITVTVPPRGAASSTPGIFDQIIYADYQSIHLDARSGEIVLNGYDSNSGNYDPASPLASSEVVIMQDGLAPFRKVCFDTSSCAPGDPEVAPIVFEGNITANVTVKFRTPTALEEGTRDPAVYAYTEDVTGFANRISGGGSFTGSLLQESRTTSLGFESQIKTGPAVDPDVDDVIHPDEYFTFGGLDPSAGDVMVICPGETVKTTEVTVEDAELVIGCSADPASAYYCEAPTKNFKDMYGYPKSCAGANPNAQVVISTRPTNIPSYTNSGQYAIWTKGTGQIIIFSPTELYYNYFGSLGGLYIDGLGMKNEVRNATSGAINPGALKIYGGTSGSSRMSDTFVTTQPFHGAIFNPYSELRFDSTGETPLEFHGSINVGQVRTDSRVRIHWDKALKTGGGGGGGGDGGTCSSTTPENCRRPIAGTWSLSNN
jgi:Tfp pilus assembly protein PilX